MKAGDILLTDVIKTCGFTPRDPKNTIKAPAGALMVSMHLGLVQPDTITTFSPDGVLLALGFGPLMWTRMQYGLVKALQSMQIYLGDQQELDDGEQSLLADIDAALAHAKSFSAAAAPTIDLIIEDAKRFRFMMKAAADEDSAEAKAMEIEVSACQDQNDVEQFVACVDAARKRCGAP